MHSSKYIINQGITSRVDFNSSIRMEARYLANTTIDLLKDVCIGYQDEGFSKVEIKKLKKYFKKYLIARLRETKF